MGERVDDSAEARPEFHWGDSRADAMVGERRRLGWVWLSILPVALLGVILSLVLLSDATSSPERRENGVEPESLIRGVLPAEFEQQQALMLVWPSHDWGKETTVGIAVAASPKLPIVLLVQGEQQQQDASRALREAGVSPSQIRFHQCATNSIWIRDFGPLLVDDPDESPWVIDSIYVVPGGVRREADEKLPAAFAKKLGLRVCNAQIVLEMGGVLNNGSGLCLVSRRLLQQNLKVGFSEASVTETLKQVIGATEVRYLDPLIGETTGHLDWFAVFTAPDTLVIGEYAAGDDDVNSAPLNRHAEALAGIETKAGPIRIVRIPMPARSTEFFGGTFTNVVFANGKLLVPAWSDASEDDERAAHEVYRQLLPEWEIIPINCDELGRHGGALRCVTMNLHRFASIEATK